MRRSISWLLTFASCAAIVLSVQAHPPSQAPAPVEHYKLVPGFVGEAYDADGRALGNGFGSTPNPWGQYTAYLLSTNARGQRTWRIENYLPNQGGQTSQGSSMYLFEGSERALLVDTAQNTVDVAPQGDLKSVVKHLLGHQNDGSVKTQPVDFVVANTHSHGDHTGKNRVMTDRAVYYPELDFPANNAPANYVPIKEGGGPSTRGNGTAVGEIALGNRTIVAVDIHQHTPGSTGYLDRDNQMIATGDAIGSAYVWAHFGTIQQYAKAVRHLTEVVAPYDRLAVLPAHFFQNAQGERRKPPLNGRPVDKPYIYDELAVADGIMSGNVVGEPYRVLGRNNVWAQVNSGQVCYTLERLYDGGIFGGAGDKTMYHAIAIPGRYGVTSGTDPISNALRNIKSEFYLIRDYANTSMYLIKGSTKALLVGTGSGTPGIAAYAARLAGTLPLEVIVTSDDADQVGGLSQFQKNHVYLPATSTMATTGLGTVTRVKQGDRIALGNDRAGQLLEIEVYSLSGHAASGLTLLDVSDRLLLTGDALGTQSGDGGLVLQDSLADFARALAAWRAATDGKYDSIYTAHNYQWYTSPAYVDQVQAAVQKGLTDGDAALIPSVRPVGLRMIRSTGAADVVASVVVSAAGR